MFIFDALLFDSQYILCVATSSHLRWYVALEVKVGVSVELKHLYSFSIKQVFKTGKKLFCGIRSK